MNKKQYEAQRKSLMDEAQRLINEGKATEAQEKMDEVKKLDKAWDAIAQAEANFRALNEDPKLNFAPQVTNFNSAEANEDENEVVKAWKSDSYKYAWAKTLQGKNLTTDESESYRLVNEAFSHTTENTSVVIPESVSRGIWEIAGEMYPYFADVTKTYVNGILTMIQEDTSSDAAWYVEASATEDGKETFKEFQLNGCELSRSVNISWKLREMATDDFIPYIQRKMAKKMGAGAGYGATHGAGAKAASGKPEPMGTVTALEAETNTPQVVTYAKGTVPKYADVIKARAKVKSGYGARLNVYANSNTIWTKIAAIEDLEGRPLFVPDPTSGGVFRILGMLVKEDDSMKDGEILFSNPEEGYHANINKEISMMTEDHVKARNTDYCGYAIMDGNVTTTKAHALLKEATA